MGGFIDPISQASAGSPTGASATAAAQAATEAARLQSIAQPQTTTGPELAGVNSNPGLQEADGPKLFADFMRGASMKSKSFLQAQNSTPGAFDPASNSTELLAQIASQSSGDPIRANLVMLDIYSRRMETMGRLHISMALASSGTNVFKQLFNRHD